MIRFEEVLDGVRLALTWASPGEIRALLEGLVEEEIISEAYSKSLSLHRLIEGITPTSIHNEPAYKPGSAEICSQSVRNLRECDISDHNQTNLESLLSVDEHSWTTSWTNTHPLYGHQITDGNNQKLIQELMEGPAMDEHYHSHRIRSTPIMCDIQCNFTIDEEMPELLISAESKQKPVSDSERTDEGNSEREREWLEQVEEAARRIAVPLWQHWDRGRKMLLPLVPTPNTGCTTTANTATDSGAQCLFLKMEEEIELAVACRTLGLYTDQLREGDVTDTNFTLDSEKATNTLEDLYFSINGSVVMTGLSMDRFDITGATSPVEACTATDTNNNLTEKLEGHLSTMEDLICLAADAQCGTDAGFIDVADLLSPCTPRDALTIAQDDSFHSNTHYSTTLGIADNVENVSRTLSSTTMSIADVITDVFEDKEDEQRVASHWGDKMQEEDQDPLLPTEFGDLPDDISEFMNEKYLLDLEGGELFGDLLSCEELCNLGDVLMPEPSSPESHQQRQSNKLMTKSNNRQKRQRVARSQECNDDNTPSKPKRPRVAGQPKTKEAQTPPVVTQNTDARLELSPAKMAGLTTSSPRIVHLSPPIQFIAIPDTSGWISPPVLFPFPTTPTAPTYILVPASPPSYKPQIPPLSPVDGAVAPVQMSSSPQGSDTHSKAAPPPPLSPNNEISPCKESPPPQSPTILDIPQAVKDYIQEAKAHMSHTCQDIEESLSLTSHYVDRHVCQREVLRSGKNTNKCLDKELVIMGDTERQKSLLGQSQIFDGSNGDKPKRYILLFGNAGIGKTTLIRKLCLDWSRDCFPQFDFVFLLDGKALTLTEPTYSLQTLLLNLSYFAPACMNSESVFAQILAAPKRVLIIFDGFDELRNYEILLQNQEKDLITSLQKDSKAQNYTVRQLYSAILQRVLLPGCTLLISTRPKGTASQVLRRADSFLEVCGFTPTDVETYLSQYFTDPTQRGSALDCLQNCSFLHHLCWNPGLCRLVCLVLEQSKGSEVLPRTLTGLCHQVLRLKMEKDCRGTHSKAEDQTQTSVQSVEETKRQVSSNTQTKSRGQVRTRSRSQKAMTKDNMTKEREKVENKVEGEETMDTGSEVDRTEERELLLQLSSLAWEGVKANSSILPTGRTLSAKLRAFGLRIEIFLSRPLRTRTFGSNGADEGGGREEKDEIREEKGERRRNRGSTDMENTDASREHILLWANPFLQGYLAGLHLSLSRTVSDRNFLQTLPFQSGPKVRRRPQRQEHELTQRFAVGLLFHKRTELQRLHSYTETVFRDMLVSKQALVRKHLEGLSYGDLSPAQVLEVCNYVYEASFTHGDDRRDGGSTQLVTHLAANLPEVLTFHGVPLNPPDVFTVKKVLKRGGTEGKSFSLNLQDSGIRVSGLRDLVGLNSINTYRACIADVITLWEQLEQSGEEGLLQGAVSKFKIHPLKATQVCHIEHLAKLVNIHTQRKLSDSSRQSDSILAEGVPAVKELHKLEFELDPDKGPLVLPKLWELLPGLHNLQHLDLEKSKIGDKGAEKLADALASLSSLEILNLSQTCIGDHGIKKLASTLRDLPKLHCLSIYSNVISDEGAESLAAVLPHMSSLTDLDVKYNKLTDVGAQSLGASLRNCQKIKTLRMWNQCIPCGVFERLQQQDSRILWH